MVYDKTNDMEVVPSTLIPRFSWFFFHVEVFGKTYLGLDVAPPWMPVANEGLGWDPRAQNYNNPGGNWHPGMGT